MAVPPGPGAKLGRGLRKPQMHLDLANITPARAALLDDLRKHYSAPKLIARVPAGETQVIPEYSNAPPERQQLQANSIDPNQAAQMFQQTPNTDLQQRAGMKNALQNESRNTANSGKEINFNVVPLGEEVPWADLAGKAGGTGHAAEVTVGTNSNRFGCGPTGNRIGWCWPESPGTLTGGSCKACCSIGRSCAIFCSRKSATCFPRRG